MKKIYYYMTLFPSENLISSMLQPEKFGAHLATGVKAGSHEQIIFAELSGGFGDDFDWKHAEKETVPHKDGRIKNSVYLAVYRVLERVPFSNIIKLYLTTADGRTMGIDKSSFPEKDEKAKYYLYQDLCPIRPLVVSSLSASEFGEHMVSDDITINLPAICYCDLKVVDPDDVSLVGNIGPIFGHKRGNLKKCIASVADGKKTKLIERTYAGRFTYQSINKGIAFVNKNEKIWFKMPDFDELNRNHYDWAKSAMIV